MRVRPNNTRWSALVVGCVLVTGSCAHDAAANPTVLRTHSQPIDADDQPLDTQATPTGEVPENDTAAGDEGALELDPSLATTTVAAQIELSESTSAGDERFPQLGSSDIDVDHYAVDLAFGADHSLCGSVTISGLAAAATDQLSFDAANLQITAARVITESTGDAGEAPNFAVGERELVLPLNAPLLPGDSFESTIEFCHQIGGGGDFATQAGVFPTERGVWSVNEPDGVSTWMPVSDHPTDKATWAFSITVPQGLTAITNGALVKSPSDSPTLSGEETSTWRWEQDEPMASYLVTLLIGEYTLVADGFSETGVPLHHAVLTAHADVLDAYLDVTDAQLSFFDNLFGPYPFDRYGVSITDSIGGLAMETQGLSLFSIDDLDGSLGYLQHLLLAHELTHQWFGDAVSPATWDDIWLNEGLATYGEWLWLDDQGLQDLESAARQAIVPSGYGGSVYAPDELFSAVVYQGGAAALHAIRRVVGDDAFFGGLRTWVATYLDSAATTEQFHEVMEQASGLELDDVFAEWVYANGQPTTFPAADG